MVTALSYGTTGLSVGQRVFGLTDWTRDGTLAERMQALERETVAAELERHGFQMTETAKALGLERSHLYKKCQQLGIPLRAGRSAPGS